jgi:hypothetical protein
MDRSKDLRHASWNMDVVCSKNLELEHFLKQQGVDMSLKLDIP